MSALHHFILLDFCANIFRIGIRILELLWLKRETFHQPQVSPYLKRHEDRIKEVVERGCDLTRGSVCGSTLQLSSGFQSRIAIHNNLCTITNDDKMEDVLLEMFTPIYQKSKRIFNLQKQSDPEISTSFGSSSYSSLKALCKQICTLYPTLPGTFSKNSWTSLEPLADSQSVTPPSQSQVKCTLEKVFFEDLSVFVCIQPVESFAVKIGCSG